MDILILGGTGAMGLPLVSLLGAAKHNVFVTTRGAHENRGSIQYIQGNAKDDVFFQELMQRSYDVIVDFMVYETEELKKRLPILLNRTSQYFFFSSSRVYAASDVPLSENSPRLLDVSEDEVYLQTDEYALAKAREEDIIRNSGKSNWTIIRPYITYNENRLQLGVYEKEHWLNRALAGKTVVIPKDILEKKTSLTYGPDVAAAMHQLIGNERAYAQIFHIVNPQSMTWGEILDHYLNTIKKYTGIKVKVKIIEDSRGLQKIWNPWQIKYDRLIDRSFDSNKIEEICGKYPYKNVYEGLEECVCKFVEKPQWLGRNWEYEAFCDRIAGERTKLREIKGRKNKVRYLFWRYFDNKTGKSL